MLAGVPFPLDFEDGELGVAALDGFAAAGGDVDEVGCFDDGLPGQAAPLRAAEVFSDAVFRPVSGALLAAFGDGFDDGEGVWGVGELLEVGPAGGGVDGFGPFAEEGADEDVHLGFEVGGDAEFVFEDDGAEVFDAAGELLDPARGALELVGGADVEH